MKTFAELIAPVTPEEFFRDYHDRKPLHIPAGEGTDKRAILDWATYNGLLAQTSHWTRHNLRLMLDTRVAQAEEYCTSVDTLRGRVMQVDPAKVELFVAMGASVVAEQMQDLSPPMSETCAMLGELFGAEVGANAYASFRNRRALMTHFDTHDVFAIHTEGEKHWKVWSSRAENPSTAEFDTPEMRQWLADNRGPLLMDVTMRPGDVLYLPRGWYHDALAGSDASLHLTLSVTPLTSSGLMGMLGEVMDREARFRGDVPPAGRDDGAALRAHLDALADQVAEVIRSGAFHDRIGAEQRRRLHRQARYDLPNRMKPTAYRRTQTPAPTFEGAAAEPMAFALAQGGFYIEEFLARFPDVDPKVLRDAVAACVAAGALAKA